ncbi:hypothetical protein ACFOWZ_04720 [Lentzea rhizosphaerae]|uniref:Extracellular repeat, HAF family n=1 Tax=Lentzea rhizosphaerae TaxID=2041025 RepID=A0ABV8BNA0_9PSEU
MIALEVPGGTTDSDASSVNRSGTVVGTVRFADGTSRAALWDRDGRYSALRVPAGFSATAFDISDSDVVTGQVWNGSDQHAVRWGADGEMTVLQSFVEGIYTYVGSVNRNGICLGEARALDGRTHAVRWDQRGRVTDLALPPEGRSSIAGNINDHDVATGTASVTIMEWGRAVVWDRDGRVTELPTLGNSATGKWINNHGVVVGSSTIPESVHSHPVRWERDGRVTALDLPAGGEFGIAYAVNDNNVAVGLVDGHAARWDEHGKLVSLEERRSIAMRINGRGVAIGSSDNPSGSIRATLWDRSGRMTDLGVLPGDVSSGARSINDSGVVAGWSRGSTGRAVIWKTRTPRARW